MKTKLSFTSGEAAQLICDSIYSEYGILVDNIEFIVEQSHTPAGDQPTGIYKLTKVTARKKDDRD